MIAQDDFAVRQRPHWLPFLELEIITQEALERLTHSCKFLRPVEMQRTPKSPSPTPPVSPRSNTAMEKKGIKSFIKDLGGSHRKKKDRSTLLLEFGACEMQNRTVFQLEEFLESILGYEELKVILGQEDHIAAIRDVWAQLQEDTNALPALWMSEWAEEEMDTFKRHEKKSSLMVFPPNLRWQFVVPALSKLPLLLDLIKAVMKAAGQWRSSFNHFAQCTCDAFLQYASDEECQALTEFLVSHCPAPEYDKIKMDFVVKSVVPFEESIFSLFLRCWSSQVVFNFSAAFWGSPWWQVLEKNKEHKRLLLNELARSVVNWNLLHKSLPKDQAEAMGAWLDIFETVEKKKRLERRWMAKKVALMQVGDSGALMEVLQTLSQLGEEGAEPSDDFNLEQADAEKQAKSLCWLVRELVKCGKLDKENSKDVLDFHQIIKNARGGEDYSLTYFWRCYLLAAVAFDANSAEQPELLKGLIVEFMQPNMSSHDVKLLCLCLPWLPTGTAQDVADALRAKIALKKSPLMATVCGSPGLRQMVALQLASYSRVASSGLALKELLAVQRLSSEGYFVAPPTGREGELALHLAYCSLILWDGGVALKRLPADVADHINNWVETLPPVARKGGDAATLNEWLDWLRNQEAAKALIAKSGMSTYLATLHIFGCWIVTNMASHGFNDSAAPDVLVRALCALASEKWPRKFLVSEMALCLLMPYASLAIQQNRDVDVLVTKLDALKDALTYSLKGVNLEGRTADELRQFESNGEQLFAVMRELPKCLDHAPKDDTQPDKPLSDGLGDSGIALAYSLVAQACLGGHLGASEERLTLADLRLQFAVLAMQKRPDASYVLSSLLLGRQRMVAEVPR